MGIFKKTKQMEITSPIKGETVPITTVPDETFSTEILGKGIAVIPLEETVVAPCDATVDLMFETAHAVNLICANGVELLIHVGIDTVALKGKYFTAHVKSGDTVKKGEKLISFQREALIKEGYASHIPVVICSKGEFNTVTPIINKQVTTNTPILILSE